MKRALVIPQPDLHSKATLHCCYKCVGMQAERGVAQELADAQADWQASHAQDTREVKVN